MIVVAVAAAVVVCVLVGVVVYLARTCSFQAAMQRDERDLWVAERRELLNRIQRPEVVQAGPVADFPTPEVEQDELGLVGSIVHDPDYEFDSTLADALTNAVFEGKG